MKNYFMNLNEIFENLKLFIYICKRQFKQSKFVALKPDSNPYVCSNRVYVYLLALTAVKICKRRKIHIKNTCNYHKILFAIHLHPSFLFRFVVNSSFY